ncbi:MAG: hypothetical protein QMD71_02465, partial [bacterium]|nr:hypothetical protein [bacterium]
IEVIEGPFLKQGGLTFFIPPCEGIDNSAGMITLCCAFLLVAPSGVSGSGTLAYIRWTVVRYGSSKIHFGIPG